MIQTSKYEIPISQWAKMRLIENWLKRNPLETDFCPNLRM